MWIETRHVERSTALQHLQASTSSLALPAACRHPDVAFRRCLPNIGPGARVRVDDIPRPEW